MPILPNGKRREYRCGDRTCGATDCLDCYPHYKPDDDYEINDAIISDDDSSTDNKLNKDSCSSQQEKQIKPCHT